VAKGKGIMITVLWGNLRLWFGTFLEEEDVLATRVLEKEERQGFETSLKSRRTEEVKKAIRC
jgi:hypothetical protein